MSTRRSFLASLGISAVAALAPAAAGRTSMYLAYTSFAVRMRQGRDILKGTAGQLGADTFRQLCLRFGAAGAQVDYSQLPLEDRQALGAIREGFAREGVEIEVSIPSRFLETPEAYARAVDVARTLGATRARVALLSGRRYESFATADDWRSFAAKWRATLLRMRPEFERHRFAIGIENHKDWLRASWPTCCVPSTARTSGPVWTSATTSPCSRIPTRRSPSSRRLR